MLSFHEIPRFFKLGQPSGANKLNNQSKDESITISRKHNYDVICSTSVEIGPPFVKFYVTHFTALL